MRLLVHEPPMAIEQLVFRVAPEHRERWLELDHEMWTVPLAKCEGFAGKEVWINADQPQEITVIIYWSGMECWQLLDRDWVVQINEAFTQASGDIDWQLARVEHEEAQMFKLAECVL